MVIRGDDAREGDETFTVRLSNAMMSGNSVEILDAGATGTIRDDEPGASVDPGSPRIREDAVVTYEVRLYTDPQMAAFLVRALDLWSD